MVLQLAHQVVWTACSRALGRSSGDPHPLQKNADGPLPQSTSLPFPKSRAGSCLDDRRAMPPLTTDEPRGRTRMNAAAVIIASS
jgi:hypothetical protein